MSKQILMYKHLWTITTHCGSGNNIGHSQSHAARTQRRTSLQLTGVHSFTQKWLSLHAIFSPAEMTCTPCTLLLSQRQSVAVNNLKMNANPRPIPCVQTCTVTILAALSFSLQKSCITSLVVKAHVFLWQSRASVTRHGSMQMLSDTSQHTLKRITWIRTRNRLIQKNGPTILMKSEATKPHLEKRMKPHSKADSMTPNAHKTCIYTSLHDILTHVRHAHSHTQLCLTSDT